MKAEVENILRLARQTTPKKKNVTFRLEERVIEEFKEICKKADVSTGRVLEELMKRFIEEEGIGDMGGRG